MFYDYTKIIFNFSVKDDLILMMIILISYLDNYASTFDIK